MNMLKYNTTGIDGVSQEFLNMSAYGVAAWLRSVHVPHKWKNIVYSLIQRE